MGGEPPLDMIDVANYLLDYQCSAAPNIKAHDILSSIH